MHSTPPPSLHSPATPVSFFLLLFYFEERRGFEERSTTGTAARQRVSRESCTSISQLTCNAAEQNIWHLPIGQQPSSNNYSLWENPRARAHTHHGTRSSNEKAGTQQQQQQTRCPLRPGIHHTSQQRHNLSPSAQELRRKHAVKRRCGMNGEIPSVAARLTQEAHARCRTTADGGAHAGAFQRDADFFSSFILFFSLFTPQKIRLRILEMSLQNNGVTRESLRGAAASKAERKREAAILQSFFLACLTGGKKSTDMMESYSKCGEAAWQSGR